jgi:hypothetical protein
MEEELCKICGKDIFEESFMISFCEETCYNVHMTRINEEDYKKHEKRRVLEVDDLNTVNAFMKNNCKTRMYPCRQCGDVTEIGITQLFCSQTCRGAFLKKVDNQVGMYSRQVPPDPQTRARRYDDSAKMCYRKLGVG